MPNDVQTTLVMGKGGVGKTTMAAGFALRSALAGRPVFYIEFTDGRSGRRLLKNHPEVKRRVFERYDTIREAASELIGSEWLTRVVLQNFAIKKMLRAAPAIGELALLDAVRRVGEQNPGAHVVVDMPATGHGLSWLRVPSRMARILQNGPLYQVARRVQDQLLGSAKTEVVIVTLPEKVVLSETLELSQRLRQEVGLVTPRLIVNRAPLYVPDNILAEVTRLENDDPAAKHYANYFRFQREQAEEDLALLAEVTVNVRAFDVQLHDPTARDVADWLERKNDSIPTSWQNDANDSEATP